MQEVDPIPEAYKPVAQLPHTEADEADAYLPAMQDTHVEATDAPTVDDARPAAQLVQLVEAAGEYVPAAHELQLVAPVLAWYKPASHGVHAPALSAE